MVYMKYKRKRKGNYPKRRPPLGERHYKAIDMLSNSRKYGNHAKIARRLGISRMTLYRWRQRPDFQAELEREIKRKVRERFGDRRTERRIWGRYLFGAVAKGDAKKLGKFFRDTGFI